MITYTTERLDDLPILFQPLNLQSLSNADRQSIAAIDAALPQTQCGPCGHMLMALSCMVKRLIYVYQAVNP